jgi:hypothetical protein
LFLEANPRFKDSTSLKNILNRGFLKKIIMIVNYNAGRRKCLQDLRELLAEKKILTKLDPKELADFIKSFHAFLEKEIFALLYVRDKASFLSALNGLLSFSDAIAGLIYHELLDDQEVIKIDGYRWIFNTRKLSTNISTKKTLKALNANVIQARDAFLARRLIRRLTP